MMHVHTCTYLWTRWTDIPIIQPFTKKAQVSQFMLYVPVYSNLTITTDKCIVSLHPLTPNVMSLTYTLQKNLSVNDKYLSSK